ncbi:hypothetical protein [Aquiflexum lacus]|uniref:hypothetical protein n=1 Tax=Aquiflexum lacus TaxID=2483805 RepID=UPI001E64DF72|nr:hypothetical protein [Aquiflexum lacus]
MINKSYTLISLLILVFLSLEVEAQRYGSAVGIRMGSNDFSRTFGLSAQQRVFKHITLEGILQSDFRNNSTAHLLVEVHRPIISKRFNYYYGAGISGGWEESFVKDTESKQILHTYGNATSGVDIIAGVELTIANTVISLDYKPNFNLSGREEFIRGQVGITARMVLVKSKEQDRKRRKKARAKKRQHKEPIGQKFKNTFNFNSK